MSDSKTTAVCVRRPSEAGLRHDADSDHFSASIMRCRSYAPDCSYHGHCVLGDCFTGGALRREITQVRKRLAELEAEIAL